MLHSSVSTGESVRGETGELLRAPLFHTPRNPFFESDSLVAISDGGLLIREGRIAGCGEYAQLRAMHPEALSRDLRGGFLIPGLIDAHVHFPQTRVLGSLGWSLLDWLEQRALPEEARMSDETYAARVAQEFVHSLAAHGTTAAMTFGAHFSAATAVLFEAAAASGIRLCAGLVLSDRCLQPELHVTPGTAYRESSALIRQFHRRGRLLYAVTPRFAVSASEAILEVCQTLRSENPDVRFQTHLNENPVEVAQVRRKFPWAADYVSVYGRFGLCGPSAVMAHNVHATDAEIEQLAATATTVAHCPASNAALGSGIFPMHRHLNSRVHFALGTDVGAGIGFGMLREALQAYLMQRVAEVPVTLDGAKLLYLATKAGALAMAIDGEAGDFETGKSADFVYLRAHPSSPLAAVIDAADGMSHILEALLTLGGAECVREVRVGGNVVYSQQAGKR